MVGTTRARGAESGAHHCRSHPLEAHIVHIDIFGRGLSTGGLVKSITEIGELKAVASKQIKTIQKAPMTPYARSLTPEEQKAKEEKVHCRHSAS